MLPHLFTILKTSFFVVGSTVALTNNAAEVCAFGKITGLSSIHGNPVPVRHVSVLICKLVAGKKSAPPCPGPFDSENIEVGEFHAWPLIRMKF